MNKSIEKFKDCLINDHKMIDENLQNQAIDYMNSDLNFFGKIKTYGNRAFYEVDMNELTKSSEFNDQCYELIMINETLQTYFHISLPNCLPKCETKPDLDDYYDFLYPYLKQNGFRTGEIFHIFLYLFEKNIEIHKEIKITKDELNDFYIKIIHFLTNNTKNEERFKYVEECLKKDFLKTKLMVSYIIKLICIDYKENYNYLSILLVSYLFYIIVEDESFSETIHSYLCENIFKRERKQNKSLENETKLTKNNINKTKKETLSSKEYNRIYKEILSFYDIDRQRSIKPLSYQEVLYVVSLLYKVNIEEKEIIKFIQNSLKDFNVLNPNPVACYNEYYEKMTYYPENRELQKSVETINSYLKEMFICNQKEYAFWKKAIDEEMHDSYLILKREYTYELEVGKKRS